MVKKENIQIIKLNEIGLKKYVNWTDFRHTHPR